MNLTCSLFFLCFILVCYTLYASREFLLTEPFSIFVDPSPFVPPLPFHGLVPALAVKRNAAMNILMEDFVDVLFS